MVSVLVLHHKHLAGLFFFEGEDGGPGRVREGVAVDREDLAHPQGWLHERAPAAADRHRRRLAARGEGEGEARVQRAGDGGGRGGRREGE